ncbi:MAG: signal peptidase II [Anaerolineaceae bacterium]
MKKYFRDYSILLLFTGIIIGLDQWTKSIVRDNLLVGAIWSPWDWLTPYARIVHWYNTGVAFGLFQDQGLIFTVLALFVVAAILYYFPRVDRKDWPLRLAMVLQLGGAVGNLIDRLTIGHVTDFISLGNFPVFNIADASISVGVAVLLLGIWIQEIKEKKMIASMISDELPAESSNGSKEVHCE